MHYSRCSLPRPLNDQELLCHDRPASMSSAASFYPSALGPYIIPMNQHPHRSGVRRPPAYSHKKSSSQPDALPVPLRRSLPVPPAAVEAPIPPLRPRKRPVAPPPPQLPNLVTDGGRTSPSPSLSYSSSSSSRSSAALSASTPPHQLPSPINFPDSRPPNELAPARKLRSLPVPPPFPMLSPTTCTTPIRLLGDDEDSGAEDEGPCPLDWDLLDEILARHAQTSAEE